MSPLRNLSKFSSPIRDKGNKNDNEIFYIIGLGSFVHVLFIVASSCLSSLIQKYSLFFTFAILLLVQ